MGYTTDFDGSFTCTPALTEEQIKILDDFSDERHEGSDFPGIWCQWVPTSDGKEIEWDGNEKFYSYIEWIKYINNKFLKPWGIVLNGSVSWSGEDSYDLGMIVAKEGKIRFKEIKPKKVSFENCDESSED